MGWGKGDEEMWKEMARCVGYRVTEEGDKGVMIGCQGTDKTHKVKVKLRDHRVRICPLLCLLLLIQLSPSLFEHLFVFFYKNKHSLFSNEKSFISFFLFCSPHLLLRPAHTI